jgi:hypothetical protein
VLYAPGYWRIETNQEINDKLKEQNKIGFIKKQKLNWLGMLNAWLRIILCRGLRDRNPCLKDQLEDRKHFGKMTFCKA